YPLLAAACRQQKEAAASRAAEQVAPFARAQVEGVADPLDRLWRLPQQHLSRRIRNHRLPELRGKQIAGVLGDGGKTTPAFARRLGKPVEKLRPGRLAHQQPRLVDEHA